MLMQMALETKSGLEAGVIGGGHSVAASRLDAQRSVSGWASEQMGGLSYLFFIRDLVHLSILPSSYVASVSHALGRPFLMTDLAGPSSRLVLQMVHMLWVDVFSRQRLGMP